VTLFFYVFFLESRVLWKLAPRQTSSASSPLGLRELERSHMAHVRLGLRGLERPPPLHCAADHCAHTPRYAVPVMLCYTTLCYATPLCDVRHTSTCAHPVVLCCTTLCHAAHHHVCTPCHAMPVVPRCTPLCHATPLCTVLHTTACTHPIVLLDWCNWVQHCRQECQQPQAHPNIGEV